MTCYKNRETKLEKHSHFVDGDDWKQFGRCNPSFARESRNIRFSIGVHDSNPFDYETICNFFYINFVEFITIHHYYYTFIVSKI